MSVLRPLAHSMTVMQPGTSREAIGALYEETGHLVLRRCARTLGDPEEAMDVTQWTYMKALEVGFEVRTRGEALSWLYRTAHQRCMWLLRNRSTRGRLRKVHRMDLVGLPPPSAEHSAVDRDLVRRALSEVDDRTGEIAVATWLQGLTTRRAAELLGVSVRTVGRARATFEKVLRSLSDSDRDVNKEVS